MTNELRNEISSTQLQLFQAKDSAAAAKKSCNCSGVKPLRVKGSTAATADVSSIDAAGSSPRYLHAALTRPSCTQVPAPGLTSIFELC